MNAPARLPSSTASIGTGFYTVPEAARLLKIPARNINRWLGGYALRSGGKAIDIAPLWTPQLPRAADHIELGFRDLIELRFVQAFITAGLGLTTIRHCLEYARACVNDERPFSTRRFLTDGRTILLDSVSEAGAAEMLDLKSRQYVFKQIIERTFKDLDIEDEAVARWRPLQGKDSIVIDPARAFGQPVAADYGVPTVVLAQAVMAEGAAERVAQIYEVPVSVVRDAVKFEDYLIAA